SNQLFHTFRMVFHGRAEFRGSQMPRFPTQSSRHLANPKIGCQKEIPPSETPTPNLQIPKNSQRSSSHIQGAAAPTFHPPSQFGGATERHSTLVRRRVGQ